MRTRRPAAGPTIASAHRGVNHDTEWGRGAAGSVHGGNRPDASDDLVRVTSPSIRRVPHGLAVSLLLWLAACASDADEPGRAYTVPLRMEDAEDRYRYVAEGAVPDIRVGDEVTFEVRNAGVLLHDLQVVAPDGDVVGTAAAVAPGDTLTLTVEFDDAGPYRLNCLVDDHLTVHQMQTVVEVREPDA